MRGFNVDNKEEQYFNEAVHASRDGKPILKLDGGFKLRPDWKTNAVDGKGRNYNPDLHGEARLNRKGYLIELVEVIKPVEVVKSIDVPPIDISASTAFNPVVHEQTENGDPVREEDGFIRLKRNWKELAVDRQGRTFNPKIHADNHELDDEGYLKVRRRRSSIPITAVNRTKAFVNKYREDGYVYYVMNDEGGRMEQFTANDWEPVMTKEGQATMNVGQARGPNTKAILMKKPIEWHEADQQRKHDLQVHNFKSKTAPKEELGQYKPNSPLR